ncbi:hypothetical protein Tco_1403222 [Tanacetum coccineum]
MLPLSYSTSKLEAVVAALTKLSPNSLWTASSATFSIGSLAENEGTAQVHEGTARRYCLKVLLLFESTAHYAQSTARCESTAVMFEVEFTVSQKMEYFVKRLRLTYISLEFTYNIDDTIGVDSARP